METPHKRRAADLHPEDPRQVIVVTEEEEGYQEYSDPFADARDAASCADRLNERFGVTPSERDALTFQSMFPAARATSRSLARRRSSPPFGSADVRKPSKAA